MTAAVSQSSSRSAATFEIADLFSPPADSQASQLPPLHVMPSSAEYVDGKLMAARFNYEWKAGEDPFSRIFFVPEFGLQFQFLRNREKTLVAVVNGKLTDKKSDVNIFKVKAYKSWEPTEEPQITVINMREWKADTDRLVRQFVESKRGDQPFGDTIRGFEVPVTDHIFISLVFSVQ